MILFACSGCGRQLAGPPELAGKPGRCPGCGLTVAVPDAGANGTATVASSPPLAPPSDETLLHPSDSLRLDPSDTLVLCTVPGYELLEEIGRGGMGVVYKARHLKLNRIVALKMILAGGHAGEGERARFRAEGEAIARLQHAGVVQVYEVGEHEGRPFFSLEFCSGGSLERKLGGTPLPAAEAARLIEALARAVQAAHEKNVLHRDLKPANVLLAGDGTLKITDFGLARKLDEAGQTQTGSIMGTPSYMAPEQAGGRTHELGPAVDVYALGAILYECLTGRPPFKSATALDTIMQVLKDDPAPPTRLNPKVPTDLETICLKCLRKESGKRYASAADLAEDLRRFQAGEPIRGRRAGTLERAAKWARRRPGVAALLAVVVILTVVGIGGILWAYSLALEERNRARQAEANTAKERDNAAKERDNAVAAEKRVQTALEGEAEQRRQGERALYFSRVGQANAEYLDGKVGRAEELLDLCPPGYAGWEWHYLSRQCDAALLTFGGGGNVLDLAYSPDGWRLATAADGDRSARIWDAETGALVRKFEEGPNTARTVAYSPNGSLLAVGYGDLAKTGEVRVYEVATGKLRHRLTGHEAALRSVAFSPDGTRLASLSGTPQWVNIEKTGQVKVWDLNEDRETLSLRCDIAGYLGRVVFSPDGQRLAAACGPMTVWEAATGKEVLTSSVLNGASSGSVFSPDGTRLVCGPWEEFTIRDASDGRLLHTCRGYRGLVWDMAFSPDGRWVASAGSDHTVRLWDTATGRELRTLRGHRGEVRRLAFRPDGKCLASCSPDGIVKVWDLTADDDALRRAHAGVAAGFAFTPDSRRVVTAVGREVIVWDAANGRDVFRFQGPADGIAVQALSPDGTRLALGATNGTVWICDPTTGRPVHELKGHDGAVLQVAFRAGGKQMVSSGVDKTVRLWDVEAGKPIRTLATKAAPIERLACQPDGPLVVGNGPLVVGPLFQEGWSGELTFWDADTGREVGVLRREWLTNACPAFSPDGRRLAVSAGSKIEVWEMAAQPWAEAAHPAFVMSGHHQAVFGVAFSLDGRRLASIAHDNNVRLWETETGEPVLTINVLAGHFAHIAFSPDGRYLSVLQNNVNTLFDAEPKAGRRLLAREKGWVWYVACSPDGRTLAASVGDDGAVRMWDAEKVGVGKGVLPPPRLLLKGHTKGVNRIAFSPDSKLLATGSWDQTARLWDARTGKELAVLKAGAPVNGLAFTPDSRVVVIGSNDGTVRLWDVQKSEEIAHLHDHSGEIWGAAVSPDGQTVAVAGAEKVVTVWDRKTLQVKAQLKGHTGLIEALAFSRDSRFLVTVGQDGGRVWNTTDWHEQTRVNEAMHSDNTVFSPDGRTLALNDLANNIILLNTTTWEEQQRIRHGARILVITWSADGKSVLVGDAANGLWQYDVTPRKDLRTAPLVLSRGDPGLWAAVVSPDGKILATGGADKLVKLWDLATIRDRRTHLPMPRLILKGHTANIRRLAFSPNNKLLASASFDNTVRLWDAVTGKELAVFKDHENDVNGIAFTSDSQTVVSGSTDGTVRLWDVQGQKETVVLRDHQNVVWAVAVSPDGKAVVAVGPGKTVTIWDRKTLQVQAKLEGHTGPVENVAFSPDGRYLVTVGEAGGRVWRTDGWQEQAQLRSSATIDAAVFSPDGHTLALCDYPGNITLWDVGEWKERRRFQHGSTTRVSGLAWTADSQALITAGNDGWLLLWEQAPSGAR